MNGKALKAQIEAEELQRVRDNATAVPVVVGRPSDYTPEEADNICAWVAEGKSLRSYCREHHRGMDTVYRWLRERGEFRAQYARAHEDRADTLADELTDIADAIAGATMEEVQAARLRIDTRKWIASKLRPTRWGDAPAPVTKSAVVFNIGLRPQLSTVDHTNAVTIDADAAPVLAQPADKVSAS